MKTFSDPILVTRPFLPDLTEFKAGIDEVWHNKWLTNDGPMLHKFQTELSRYLNVPEANMALFNNGTLALELGYYAMGLSGGDVITTPFTFVATSHALKRIGATPVFADIDPETLCLDPKKVEPLITSRTKAIVPVHVYGNVCDIAAFDALSKKYGIPVIYDAAHAFGVTRNSAEDCEVRAKGCGVSAEGSLRRSFESEARPTSIAACGDMSMFSFHPTKLFHSCEGGLLVFKDGDQFHCPPTFSTSTSNTLQGKLFELRNFAIHGELSCTDVGSNAKMNELQALMGLCCLRHIDELLSYREAIYQAYSEVFNNPLSTSTSNLDLLPHSANRAYVPVVFKTSEMRERVYEQLKTCGVYSRRYFYPLLTDFEPYFYAKGTCPIAQDIASRVLTLPTYFGLPLEDVKSIAQNVLEIVGS